MNPMQEVSFMFGLVLLVISLVLYVQDKTAEEGGIIRHLWYRVGLRKPNEVEKWWHRDYLLGHVAWCLGLRELTFFWQRRTRGFDDSAMWSLDDTIIRFTLPRLKAFRNLRNGEGPMGYPAGLAEDYGISDDEAFAKWLEIIDKMIESMETWVRSEGAPDLDGWDYENDKYDPEKTKERWNKFQEGMDLFHIYFFALWD